MRRRPLGLTAVLVLVAGGAWAAWNAWTPKGDEPVAVADVGTISQIVVAIGRVEPVTEITLANKIPGRIKAVLVKEGDTIKAGQPVILFDNQEFVAQRRVAETRVAKSQAEVARARRALETAHARWVDIKSAARAQEVERGRAELEQMRQRWQNAEAERLRFERLLKNDYVARSQYDAAATESEVAKARVRAADETLSLLLAGPKPETVEAAWAQVRQAEEELRVAQSQVTQDLAELEHARAVIQTTIVESTVDGKVTRKLVEPGEAVDIGMPLMVLADVGKTIVKAEVDETDLGKLDVGQRAEITAEAYPGRVFRGAVYDIGQAVGRRKVRPEDPKKIQDMKVLETKIDLVEGGRDLKLGMTVDVKIVVAHKEKVLVIPRRLVAVGGGETVVSVLGPRGPEPRRITVGLWDDARVEVVNGLALGDRVLAQRPSRP